MLSGADKFKHPNTPVYFLSFAARYSVTEHDVASGMSRNETGTHGGVNDITQLSPSPSDFLSSPRSRLCPTLQPRFPHFRTNVSQNRT
jgi:hypothetical protein